MKRRLRLGAEVGIRQAPLPSAAEPHRLGIAQHGDELIRVRDLRIVRVQKMNIRCASPFEHLHRTRRFVVIGVGAGGRHDDDLGVASAGRLKKPVKNHLRHPAATDDDQ